ncbi:hypothetical protein ATANTOWER_017730 [Ataeniobius toweri]|uniref:Uncharacterized protein n=1 Tax=Ataeniobius toweri TaxID=208326 RepID=A0ABU7B791_9TELE|nr:hypothetical protein [Ataeniobius toweri]
MIPGPNLPFNTPLFSSTSRLCSSVFFTSFSPFCFGHLTKLNLIIQEGDNSKTLSLRRQRHTQQQGQPHLLNKIGISSSPLSESLSAANRITLKLKLFGRTF